MDNEINELKIAINNLTVQLSIVSVENQLLKSLVLGIIEEKMPEDYKSIYSNFVDCYEKNLNEVFDKLPESLFDTGDPSFLIRQMYRIFEDVQSMKRGDTYQDY